MGSYPNIKAKRLNSSALKDLETFSKSQNFEKCISTSTDNWKYLETFSEFQNFEKFKYQYQYLKTLRKLFQGISKL